MTRRFPLSRAFTGLRRAHATWATAGLVAAGAAAVPLLSSGPAAADNSAPTVSLTLRQHNQKTPTTIPITWTDGHLLPLGFLGLGFDYPEVPVTNNPTDSSAPRTDAGTLANVISSLQITDDGPLVLRVGGTTSDVSGIFDNSSGQLAMCSGQVDPNATGQVSPVVPASSAASTGWVSGLQWIARNAPVQLLLDEDYPHTQVAGSGPAPCVPSNAANKSSQFNALATGIAAETNTAAIPTIGLYGVELGNEPDLAYQPITGTKTSVTPTAYASAFSAFAGGFTPLPGVAVAGPALSFPGTTPTANSCSGIKSPTPGESGQDWLGDAAQAVTRNSNLLLTGHTYGGGDPSTGGWSVGKLLLQGNITGLVHDHVWCPAQEVASDLRSDARNVPAGWSPDFHYRVDEFNSMTFGGQKGVTNSFADSLWMTDALSSLIDTNAMDEWPAGVNVHVREDPRTAGQTGNDLGSKNLANASFDLFDPGTAGNGKAIAGSPNVTAEAGLYGMLMFTCALDAKNSWCNGAQNAKNAAEADFVPMEQYNGTVGRTMNAYTVRVGDGSTNSQMRFLFINTGNYSSTETVNVSGNPTANAISLTNVPSATAPSKYTSTTASKIHFAGTKNVTMPSTGIMPAVTGKPVKPVNGALNVAVPGHTEKLVTVTW